MGSQFEQQFSLDYTREPTRLALDQLKPKYVNGPGSDV